MLNRALVTTAAALLGTSLLAAPARAEVYSVDDPADATASLTDIYGLQARHGSENLLVKVRFQELLSSSAAGVSVYVDTDRARRGPEFVLHSGLGDGTDYVLAKAIGWRRTGEPVDCDYVARPVWDKNTFRARISRGCLGDPSAVRVSVQMIDQADGSHPVTDWAPRRHRWGLSIRPGQSV